APLAALAFLAAGCGGGGSSSDTESATAWADDVCSAIKTWTTSLSGTIDSLRSGGGSKGAIQNAADHAQGAPGTLRDGIRAIGKPDTESGEQAKSALNDLADQLNQDVDNVQKTLDSSSGIAEKASAVASTASTVSSQISSTFNQLQQIDAGGELQDAFTS